MRIDEHLLFSPNNKFEDIDLKDKNLLIDAFKDRVEGFYLEPINLLNTNKKAFASGTLCTTAIDFLARIYFSDDKDRVGWRIKKLFKEFMINDTKNASYFYKFFRNGLVHEGRIKKGHQFSYDFPELIFEDNDIMIINPKILLDKISIFLDKYCEELKNDEDKFNHFRNMIQNDMEKELTTNNAY